MANEQHYLKSSSREALLEHLLLGEILRHLWISGVPDVEILKPQVDNAGYDVAIETRGVIRHIQFKTSHAKGKRRSVNVNLRLSDKPSGCVTWTFFEENTLALGPFYWLGGKPGKLLPDIRGGKVSRHAKANAKGQKSKRLGHRDVRKTEFEELGSIRELVEKLFGR